MNKVSIVIPVYNQLKMTVNCLNDILKTTDIDYEVIVVDDGSKKEPVSMAIKKMFPNVMVLFNEKNLGFAKTVNKGILASTGNYILLLNNDIRIQKPNWLKIMLDNMKNKNLDLTAPAGGRMDKNWNYISGEAKRDNDPYFSYLVGWALLVNRNVFDKIGNMPEMFGVGFFEDCLFCYRAKKAGFKMGITENIGITHLYHQTFKAEGYNLGREYEEKRKIFLKEIGR